ncbi:hypothetical protein E2C01_045579 [Portunus trituberculatus]|uniref:Uncharacterized protein n=1 Tax=Portunus trituberculatus TaxID=210409 RepID=A0A5B7G1K4_PORTR|nr:hypothetical protein [Portunus trituberculatus]
MSCLTVLCRWGEVEGSGGTGRGAVVSVLNEHIIRATKWRPSRHQLTGKRQQAEKRLPVCVADTRPAGREPPSSCVLLTPAAARGVLSLSRQEREIVCKLVEKRNDISRAAEHTRRCANTPLFVPRASRDAAL